MIKNKEVEHSSSKHDQTTSESGLTNELEVGTKKKVFSERGWVMARSTADFVSTTSMVEAHLGFKIVSRFGKLAKAPNTFEIRRAWRMMVDTIQPNHKILHTSGPLRSSVASEMRGLKRGPNLNGKTMHP